MAKNFSELRNKMSPERRAEIDEKVKKPSLKCRSKSCEMPAAFRKKCLPKLCIYSSRL